MRNKMHPVKNDPKFKSSLRRKPEANSIKRVNNETKNAKLGQSNKKKAKYQTKLVVSSF